MVSCFFNVVEMTNPIMFIWSKYFDHSRYQNLYKKTPERDKKSENLYVVTAFVCICIEPVYSKT